MGKATALCSCVWVASGLGIASGLEPSDDAAAVVGGDDMADPVQEQRRVVVTVRAIGIEHASTCCPELAHRVVGDVLIAGEAGPLGHDKATRPVLVHRCEGLAQPRPFFERDGAA